MAQTGTLETIVEEFANLFFPLRERLEAQEIRLLFAELGMQFPPELDDLSSFSVPLEQLAVRLKNLPFMVSDLNRAIDSKDSELILQKSKELILVSSDIIQQIAEVASALQGLSSADLPGIPQSALEDFAQNLPVSLLDYLLITYLERRTELTEILELFQIVKRTDENIGLLDSVLPPYTKRELFLSQLSNSLTAPIEIFEALYDWGKPEFDGTKLFDLLAKIISRTGAPAYFDDTEPSLDLVGILIKPFPDAVSPGLNILLFSGLGFDETITFKESDWEASLIVDLVSPSILEVIVQSNGNISVKTGAEDLALNGEIIARWISKSPEQEEAYLILGQAGGSRLETRVISAEAGINLVWRPDTNQAETFPRAEAKIIEGIIVINASESDGFLNNMLSGVNIESNFDLAISVSADNGVYFKGSTTLEISFSLHKNLGLIEFLALNITFGFSDEGIQIGVGGDLKFNLGPLVAIVEGVGIKSKLAFTQDKKGNLGPLNFDGLRFKPPNGVGLSIDAGAVKGGGYLFFDPDREEYAGALELIFSEWIALKAIGLITTKLPDGSKGFSLLIIITVEFGTGIQLGFGFTLLGVGGLLGLNRTVKVDALKEGIKSNAIESVMFPEDVVANAPKIISDLRQFFPPARDVFLVGPMAKIGWGTPTLVSVTLGVILEFPDVNITILGVVKVALPDEDAAVLRLQVNFIGRFEPSNKLLWFYAELYDSRILTMTIEGGMGLLVNWGDKANFVFSVGGFHPRYTPPPLPFDAPPRLAINLFNESWLKLRAEGYFAVTSNTVQFGARLELFVGVSAFNIDGHFGLDVLFQFNPFYFIFELSVSLSVKLFGFGLFSVGFSGMVEGPTPWHIKGKGKIGFWLFSVSVPFEHTWGESRHSELPPIAVLPLIEQEFEALTNWESVIPKSSSILVALRKLGESPSATDQLVLHPVGKLRISQRKMPLGIVLEKFGNQRPEDVNKLSVSARITGGIDLFSSPVKEKFATGEFRKLDNANKLSSPGFVNYDSGIEVGIEGEQLRTGQAVKRIIRYETIIIDNNFKRFQIPFFKVSKELFNNFGLLMGRLFGHFLNGNAVTKSVLSQHYQTQIQPNVVGIQIQDNLYSVAHIQDNTPMTNAAGDSLTQFTSQAQAQDYLQEQIGQNANLEAQLHIIPNTEVNLAL